MNSLDIKQTKHTRERDLEDEEEEREGTKLSGCVASLPLLTAATVIRQEDLLVLCATYCFCGLGRLERW